MTYQPRWTVVYLDEVERDHIGVGFLAWPDVRQFIGFVRREACDPGDARYRHGEVSIELGLDGLPRGIFANAIESVWLDGNQLRVALGGELSGRLEVGIEGAATDFARLRTTLEVIFDGTGRLLGTPSS
jgi:hypothetical protein